MPNETLRQRAASMALDRFVQQYGGPDYDIQGYLEKYGLPNWIKGQHLTDEFKRPSHITFSNESIYSTKDKEGGKWVKKDGRWYFYASPYNLTRHPPEELIRYFQMYEPDSVLVLPEGR